MDNLAERIINATKTSFIDSSIESQEDFRPKLIYNDYTKGNTVLANLEKELNLCESFWFSVAFITKSGIICLKETLKELRIRGIKGKILTTDYLSFNEPDALRELLEYNDNIEVKIFTKEHFHTKGYMFKNKEKYTFVVGSSNMTQNALKANKEWNLRVTSLENGELINETVREFKTMWEQAIPLTKEWIQEEYEPVWKAKRSVERGQKVVRLKTHKLAPNKMQEEATKNLARLREEGENKALLISATGTGKTYLAAFDVANIKPKKMLFLVHREQILRQAMESFKDVLGQGINSGLLSGTSKNYDADYLFSTVQMMSKIDVMQRFGEGYFDYICLDETHRSGAESYQRIINYFKPTFLLGMTATPERTDGFDIYSQFDHNIAYEIRLQQAMQEKMLCPFHYFGITELMIDGAVIDDTTDFKKLVSEQRVDNIIDKVEFYGHSGDRVKGLMFCSRKDEAKELSRLFNERNYSTVALCGDDSQEARENAITRLEQDEVEGSLDYIFTVDIFNEGVDIPAINQVVMLRPTQSAIIFVQQLGRGLRKEPNKEYVVVIDFIGNYAKNFLIPIALSGDRTYNKDTIRKYVVEGNRVIPGCSTVNFDAIAKERIFNSIDRIKGIRKIIKDSYINLKYKLGMVPTLVEFYENGEVDPSLILENYKSYYLFLQSVETSYRGKQLSENDLITLEYLSKIISRGKRPHELEILRLIISQGKFTTDDMKKMLEEKYSLTSNEKDIKAACSVLEGSFVSKDLEKDKYSHIDILVEKNTGNYERIFSFYERMQHNEFRNQINDLVELGIKKYQDVSNSTRNRRNEFVLYEKYSRRDVCLLLNWGKDLSSTMYGMKRLKDDVAIFVTYNKVGGNNERAYVEGKPDYADEFIKDSKNVFTWDSQIGRGPNSSYVMDVCDPKRKHLFIKKSDNEGTDYYYMGLFDVLEVLGDKKKDNKGRLREISKMKFKLHDSVREDLKDYLESN